ncbi:MAG: phospholipid carrier-dependent glycosyltransferase [Egibacteraceae bacterium]
MVVDTSNRDTVHAEPATARPLPDRRARALTLLIPLALMAVAGTLRFYRLDEPKRCYFDETYYYYNARDYLDHGVERAFAVHPPVGKWMIAGGIELFGVPRGSPIDRAVTQDPSGCSQRQQHENLPARAREAAESFARRFSSALVGTLWVGVAYLAGLRLFRRRGTAALAALLLAVDGLAFTMSRIAMLDVFVAFWVLVSFWLLLVDRDRQWSGVPETSPERPLPAAALPDRPHGARWLAGLALGLAVATKWSGLFAVVAAVVFVLISELAWRRRVTGRCWVRPSRIVASAGLTLVLVPAAVYVLSYAGWFANFEHTLPGKAPCPEQGCPTSLPGQVERIVKGWAGEQAAIFRFHYGLTTEHAYRGSAATWPLMIRPVAYYYEDCTEAKIAKGERCVVAKGDVAEILGMGNPAIWWMALPAYLLLGWLAVRWRDWAAWAILAFLALQYFPWLASPRTAFFFYATPLVPFVCYALAYAATQLGSHRRLRWLPPAVATIALGSFLFWYPLLTGLEISKAAWDMRIWLRPGWV